MNFFARIWSWVAMVVGLGFTALGAYLLARWSLRWFLIVVVVLVCALFLFVLPSLYPPPTFLDPDLPPLFLNHFWTWVLTFVLGITSSVSFLVRTLRAARPMTTEAEPADLAGKFPDIEAAWQEVVVRLHQAQIDPANLHFFLLFAPHEDWASALIQSAGLQLFAQAPEAVAPIHAYATSEAVFLSVSGASALGTQGVDGIQRLEALCRLLLAQEPDCPVVRGAVVIFPISWAGQPDSVKWTAALRDDLRALQRTLKVRLPVFALFSEMEITPGFGEFIARMPAALRQSRCGFAVPGSQAFSADLIQRGFIWISGWFHGWTLSLMSQDVLSHAGNRQLFCLDYEIRRYRKRLRAILEAAFSTPRESVPILFRGCYFTATGASTTDQAFSAGLLRGPRARVIADQMAATWTEQAIDDNRYYRRLAFGIGLGGGLLALLTWVYIIVVTQNPWWWAGLVAVALAWSVACFRISRW